MGDHFFQFFSPRDILEKAKRDLDRLREDPDIDNVFNFFVTAYHVMDYVRAQGIVSNASQDQLYLEDDFRMCKFICNKGKHLVLKHGNNYETYRRPGSTLGDFTIGETLLGIGPAYLVIDDTDRIDAVQLAERIVERWERFFRDNGLE